MESLFKQTTQPEGDSTKISVFDQMNLEEIWKDFPLFIHIEKFNSHSDPNLPPEVMILTNLN